MTSNLNSFKLMEFKNSLKLKGNLIINMIATMNYKNNIYCN
jgi:hypothetical protein